MDDNSAMAQRRSLRRSILPVAEHIAVDSPEKLRRGDAQGAQGHPQQQRSRAGESREWTRRTRRPPR